MSLLTRRERQALSTASPNAGAGRPCMAIPQLCFDTRKSLSLGLQNRFISSFIPGQCMDMLLPLQFVFVQSHHPTGESALRSTYEPPQSTLPRKPGWSSLLYSVNTRPQRISIRVRQRGDRDSCTFGPRRVKCYCVLCRAPGHFSHSPIPDHPEGQPTNRRYCEGM